MDEELRELFAAIARQDATALARSIRGTPALAKAALGEGVARSGRKEFFLESVLRQFYVGDTALHAAAAAHWPAGIGALLKAGASHTATNRHRQTPLHYACSGGPGLGDWDPNAQSATIRTLLEAGAEVNARAKSDITPLHTAVRNRCALAVETLLKGGADPRAKNKSGSTPAHLATVASGRGGTGGALAKAEQVRIIALLR